MDMTEVEAQTQWLTVTEQRAWRGFLLASRLVMDQLGRELQDADDLSLTDYGILVRLSEEPNRRLRMTELAASSGLSKSRLSHQMTRLEQRGLTVRENCPDDARGTLAVLTDDGHTALTAASHMHVMGVREHLLNNFEPEQVAELARWTEQVVRKLDSDGRSGPLLPHLEHL